MDDIAKMMTTASGMVIGSFSNTTTDKEYIQARNKLVIARIIIRKCSNL